MLPPDAWKNAEQPLATDRFTLEPMVQDHAEELFAGLSAPELYPFIPEEPPASVEKLRARLLRWEARRSTAGDEVWLNYAVRDRASGELRGTLQATVMDAGFSYIAYFVFVESWRQGVARESCRELIRFLFEAFPIERVVAHVDTRNERSLHLLRALGFRLSETIRNADNFKGASSDEHVLVRTRADWASDLP